MAGLVTLALVAAVGTPVPSAHEHDHEHADEHFHMIHLNGKPACASLAPGSDPSAIDVLEELIGHPHPNPLGYATTSRWSSTASGSNGTLGSPVTLTYSFVPDGTIPSEGSTISNTLHASFDGKFGSTDAWKDIFRESFAEWGALTGITYIEETNDDGASWPETPGVLGVRGDIRIVSIGIDGASNVLGFNYFPNWGDMALDSAEPWGNSSNDYRFFRNTLLHEMGHGIGLLHVWPLNNSKLMEPFLNENFAGPQDDDARSGMSLYDDRAGNNRTMESAFDIGAYSDGMQVEDLCLRNGNDSDWYWLACSPGDRFKVTARPIGSTYATGGSSGSTPTVDSLRQQTLNVSLYDASGNLLRQAFGSLGDATTTAVLPVPSGASGIFIEVSPQNTGGDVQRYSIEVDASAAALHDVDVIAVNPEGFSLQVAPADINGTASMPFASPQTLVYEDGTLVSFTADPGTTDFSFSRWSIDGVDYAEGQRTVTVTINGETDAVAYYGQVFDATIEGNRSLIPGESTLLTIRASGGQAPYSFAWSPANLVSNPTSATTQVTPNEDTALSVTVTDAFGEVVTRPITFDFVDPLELSVSGAQEVIVGKIPLLEADVSGGSLPYRYSWSPVADNTDPTQQAYAPPMLEAGSFTYYVTVTDAAGRQQSATIPVSVIGALDVDVPEEFFATAGDEVGIDATVTGGKAPFSIRWFEGPRSLDSTSGRLNVAPDRTTMYLVEVTDALGQTAAAVTRVEVAQRLQVVVAASRTVLKPNESAVLDALAQGGTPPLSYSWDPPLRMSAPDGNSTTVFPEQSTVYTVTVTDAQGRTAFDTVRLTLDNGVTQPLEDPVDPFADSGGGIDDLTPIAPVAPCGFGIASFAPLTALALFSGRRTRRTRK